jgi:hypothetical protein
MGEEEPEEKRKRGIYGYSLLRRRSGAVLHVQLLQLTCGPMRRGAHMSAAVTARLRFDCEEGGGEENFSFFLSLPFIYFFVLARGLRSLWGWPFSNRVLPFSANYDYGLLL